MKTVFFIRHAKSSWADSSLRDIERPLNKRGLRDAPFMAQMLRSRGIIVDQILSSPANRAYTTATYFADAMQIDKASIVVRHDIYEAYPQSILNILHTLPAHLQKVLIFGHNPTFTSLANMFSDDYLPNVPTCGIVKVEMEEKEWPLFNPDTARMTAFYYPKHYF
ncbi:MAG: histidine phosphatase family protein [Bacteroidota bacterium]